MSDEQLSGRALRVIDWLQDPDQTAWTGGYTDLTGKTQPLRIRDYSADGEWFAVQNFYSTGSKTIAELIAAGAIEMRPDNKRGEPRVYRLTENYKVEQDFGDLWVAP